MNQPSTITPRRELSVAARLVKLIESWDTPDAADQSPHRTAAEQRPDAQQQAPHSTNDDRH